MTSAFGLRFALPLTVALGSAAAYANSASDCTPITDDQQRLACYDRLFRVAAAEQDLTSEDEIIRQQTSALEKRRMAERFNYDDAFSILPHHPSYLMPVTHSQKPNGKPFADRIEQLDEEATIDHTEVKFQFSFKIPLAQDVVFNNDSIWFGYTQRSLWQAYNSDVSAPFRSTDYQPEFIWSLMTDTDLLGLPLANMALHLNHQSNGQAGSISRSWNRVMASFTFAEDNWAIVVQPWYRIPEDDDEDENPGIYNYLGYGNLLATYKWRDYTFSSTLRNNLQGSDDNKTSGSLSVSFPLLDKLDGYIEYYNGYGETLLDYDHRNQRLGIGFVINDWL